MSECGIFDYLNSTEAVKDLDNMQWVAFTDKFKDTNLCFKSEGWNVEVNGGLKPDYFPKTDCVVAFYDKLAERIAIALNLVRGKTTEELKQQLKGGKNDENFP